MFRTELLVTVNRPPGCDPDRSPVGDRYVPPDRGHFEDRPARVRRRRLRL